MINNNSTFGIEEAQKLIDKFSETLAQRGIPTLSISDMSGNRRTERSEPSNSRRKE
jgi:murein endopeptidase